MKKCKICERPMADDSTFCPCCGAAVSSDHSEENYDFEDIPVPQSAKSEEVSEGRVKLCPDGKYRWIYEYNMFKNPSIFILLVKIFLFVALGIWVFFVIIELIGNGDWRIIMDFGMTMLFTFGILFVLTILAYLLIALIYKGKYIICFEMDEDGVLHQQQKEQVKKAKALSWLTVMAGLAGRDATTMGIGMNSSTKNSIYSSFYSVRSVRAYRWRNLIKVNELLYKNQVYVADEDFDFVHNYIKSRCPHLKEKQ